MDLDRSDYSGSSDEAEYFASATYSPRFKSTHPNTPSLLLDRELNKLCTRASALQTHWTRVVATMYQMRCDLARVTPLHEAPAPTAAVAVHEAATSRAHSSAKTTRSHTHDEYPSETDLDTCSSYAALVTRIDNLNVR